MCEYVDLNTLIITEQVELEGNVSEEILYCSDTSESESDDYYSNYVTGRNKGIKKNYALYAFFDKNEFMEKRSYDTNVLTFFKKMVCLE